jgi:hypothetical protein
VTEPENNASNADWATQLVDSLENVIDLVRSRTTEPVKQAARYLVLGLTILGLALSAFFLLTIGLIRLVDRYCPTGIWLPYLVIGGIFWIGGWIVWSMRHAKP